MWGVVVLVLSLSTAEEHALRQASRGCGITETFVLTGNRNWYLTVVFRVTVTVDEPRRFLYW